MQVVEKINEEEMKLIRKLANRYPYQNIPELMDLKVKIESTLNIAKFQRKAFQEALRAFNNTIRSLGEAGRYSIETNGEIWYKHYKLNEKYRIGKIEDIRSFEVMSDYIVLHGPIKCSELTIFGATF